MSDCQDDNVDQTQQRIQDLQLNDEQDNPHQRSLNYLRHLLQNLELLNSDNNDIEHDSDESKIDNESTHSFHVISRNATNTTPPHQNNTDNPSPIQQNKIEPLLATRKRTSQLISQATTTPTMTRWGALHELDNTEQNKETPDLTSKLHYEENNSLLSTPHIKTLSFPSEQKLKLAPHHNPTPPKLRAMTTQEPNPNNDNEITKIPQLMHIKTNKTYIKPNLDCTFYAKSLIDSMHTTTPNAAPLNDAKLTDCTFYAKSLIDSKHTATLNAAPLNNAKPTQPTEPSNINKQTTTKTNKHKTNQTQPTKQPTPNSINKPQISIPNEHQIINNQKSLNRILSETNEALQQGSNTIKTKIETAHQYIHPKTTRTKSTNYYEPPNHLTHKTTTPPKGYSISKTNIKGTIYITLINFQTQHTNTMKITKPPKNTDIPSEQIELWLRAHIPHVTPEPLQALDLSLLCVSVCLCVQSKRDGHEIIMRMCVSVCLCVQSKRDGQAIMIRPLLDLSLLYVCPCVCVSSLKEMVNRL